MSYTCSICQEHVEGDLIDLRDHTEDHIVDEIKKKHPDWTDDHGVCEKCVNYYRGQIQGTE